MQHLTFSNGDLIPSLGLGTWKSKPGEVEEAVYQSIKLGYRHIDCAAIYANEKEVGNAIKKAILEGIIERQDLFVTSKLWNNAHHPEHVLPALRKTLADLKLEYLDLYLIHWPVAQDPESQFPKKPGDFISLNEISLSDTWEGMEECHNTGLAKHIGVSNFNQSQIEQVNKNARIKIEMNQIELHPYLQQNDLVDFCLQNKILVTAYSPLGSMDRDEMMKKENEPILLESEVIKNIAEKRKMTPAQVLLRWAIARHTIVIPKSVNPKRLKENLEATNYELDQGDIKAISTLNKNYRFVDGSFWTIEGSPYSMEALWGE
ncbi:MAG: aldo/keto reductase [Cyclobacteriaceae bacterium]|nr:aldo/keto reductase [Cyclobacteriaceae bacterium]MCH8517258.1 aldo/keto reductase [Cyclobacteriaceae bacterium]